MARNLTSRIEAARHAVRLALRLIAERGPLRVVDGALFAGETSLYGDETIVDAVYEQTLFGCTIFLGSVRIATRATARNSTVRALGTHTNDEVIEKVFEKGEVFEGQTGTLGKQWAIVYVPLDDADGRRIGMLATFRELME